MSDWPGRPDGPLRRHTLPLSAFRDVCKGPVAADIIKLIRTTQYSRRKLQLHALAGLAIDDPTAVGTLTGMEEVWSLLSTVESRAPEIVEDVLMYPTVGAWLSRMVHRMATDEPATTPLWTELGYLHSMTAAAAIRANVPISIHVPVLYGAINLPTVGQIRLPVAFPIGVAQVLADGRGVRLCAGAVEVALPIELEEQTTDYLPTRTHVSRDEGRELRLRIEDTDPYRAFSAPRRPCRLSFLDAADWGKRIDEAWHLLSASHAHYADEIAVGLTTIMPTIDDDELLAASSPSAFGGMMLASPESAAAMAEVVVHELQHSKLNALLDLVALLDEPGTATEYAPWRDDPRTPIGLLHGIYAFASAVEFHQVERAHANSPDTTQADLLFAYRRAQVRDAIDVVRALPTLTDLGQQFVDIAAGRIAACDEEPVDADVLDAVAAMTVDHRATWRMRHHHVDTNYVDRLSAAWSRGHAATAPTPRTLTVRSDERRVTPSRRNAMTRLKLLDPDGFADLFRRHDHTVDGAVTADLAYVSGDHARSTEIYAARISRDSTDWQSWIGLGLCALAQGDQASARGLLDWPAVVVAAHDRLRQPTGITADPIAVASWVGRSG